VKRTALTKLISGAAKANGLTWTQVASKGNHEKWRLGTSVQVSVPRHSEINEITAQAILKSTESELGEEWWK
jgi:predicted RNA binding protein YcfA (HicA-like mRNA interferase family)